jgi:hypothetical protein
MNCPEDGSSLKIRSLIMKITFITPLAAALMLSGAALAQEQTAPPAATPPPPSATAPAPSATTPSEEPAVTLSPSQLPSTTADNASAPILSDEQATALKNKVVWSSDQKNVGEIAEVVRDGTGRVTELHADIGGFLGFGETRVRVMPDEVKFMPDRVVLTRSEDQVSTLPKITEN